MGLYALATGTAATILQGCSAVGQCGKDETREREMASRCSRAMRTIRSLLVPSAEQASVPDFVDVDYRRAIVWVRQLRVCQWAATTGSWEVRADEVTTLCTAGVWTARPSELANLLNTV